MDAKRFLGAQALIIGIANYDHARKLPESVLHDARDLAALLVAPERCGYDPKNVVILLDAAATKSAILAALDDLGRRANADDIVCIYFSGHGWRAHDAEESYLLPVEASHEALDASAISASNFSSRLEAVRAGRLVVVLDACHAGGAGTLKDGFGADVMVQNLSSGALDLLATGSGRAIIASSRLEETSLILPGSRNSAFTTALLEGLRGAADVHQTGTIKVFNLFEFVAERVPALTTGRQHPLLRTKLETNFPIALADTRSSIAIDTSLRRERLQGILPELYPAGPTDRDIWERAGGDLSQLTLGKAGRSMWFEALKFLAKGGGGGGDIDMQRLLSEALKDFPRNASLLALT